jgi:hypothetical protein
MTGQPSEIEAFSRIMKRLSVFSERLFWVLMPVSLVFDANGSYPSQLLIKPRLDSYFELTRLCDQFSQLFLTLTFAFSNFSITFRR